MQNNTGKNILYLVTEAYHGYGGISQYNKDFLQALCDIEEMLNVTALPRCFNFYTEENDIYPKKLRYIERAANSIKNYMTQIIKLIFSHAQYDLIICAHINLLPFSYILSKRFNCQLALIIYGIDVWQPHKSWLIRVMTPKINYLISISEFTKQRFFSWANLALDESFILPCVIDLEKFTPGLPRTEVTNLYPLQDKKVILTLCRLSASEQYKGIDEILDVLPEILQTEKNVLYMIVGTGDDVPRLKNKVKSLQLEPYVIFTGRVSDHDKIDYYRLSHVFAMPGRGEGFGIVYLEALACGIPTIGSTLDASLETLMNGKLGMVVDPRSREALITAIQLALTQPKRSVPPLLTTYSLENFRQTLSTIIKAMFINL